MPVVHRENHRDLLHDDPAAGRPRSVDAVVVPAHRPAIHLNASAQLATELGCPLLLMCDPDGADPEAFRRSARHEFPRLVTHAVHVPDGYRHRLLPASAVPDPTSHDWRHGALSTKRNLALLIARLLGWRTLFLVDDDMIELDARTVLRAASALATSRAVGFTVAEFPDNSVVCHANRLSSPGQDVFVGACALVLDTSGPFGFFPSVYNEDWLFLYDAVADGAVGRMDGVRQQPYDPFVDPRRARAEEFGDVIAEGLMGALQDGHPARPPTDPGYWRTFLAARLRFVRMAEIGVPPSAVGFDRYAVMRALRASRERLAEIDAERCAAFVRGWRDDLLVWHEQLDDLPSVSDIDAAVDYLSRSATLAGLIA